MWKELSAYFVIFLLVGLFGGYAWLTHHPETPWLEEAEAWPVVGPLAEQFRDYYLPPDAPAQPDGPPLVDIVYVDENGNPIEGPLKLEGPGLRPTPRASAPTSSSAAEVEARARRIRDAGSSRLPPRPKPPELVDGALQQTAPTIGMAPFMAGGWEWFFTGQPILPEPDRSAKPLLHLRATAFLPLLSQDGFWVQVFYDGKPGWIDTTWEPDFDPKKARRAARLNFQEPVKGRDRGNLRKARKILGLREANGQLGPYELYTDVEDAELLSFLDGLAARAEDAYYARYGRLPSGDPLHSIVLFANEEDYRQVSPRVTSAGHAGGGIATLYVGKGKRHGVARILLHELTHLMNTRSMHRNLPAWLEEGLASDLSMVWMEDSDEILSENAAGGYAPGRDIFELFYQGPEELIAYVAAMVRQNRMPPTAQLLVLRREAFYAPANVWLTYSHAAVLVRFLLEGENGALRPAFLEYLAKVSKGHLPTPELLTETLGIEAEALDQRLKLWISEEEQAGLERVKRRAQRSRGR